MENEEKQEPSVIEQIEAIKNTDEFKTLVKNEAKNYIGSELKTVYNTFDGVVKETLGLEKPEDVKTSEWIKQNLSKLTEVQKELEAAKAKGEGNKEQEKLWSDKVNKLKSALDAKENEMKQIAQKGFEQNVSNQLDTFLVGKTFNPTYSEVVVKTLVEATRSKIVSNTRKLDNGKVAVWNPEKEQYYTDTLGEPLSPAQVAEQMFTPMFHTNKKGGAAKGDTVDINATAEGEVVAIDSSRIKTISQFYDEMKPILAKKGLTANSKKALEITRATMAHYKINDLPLG